MNINNITSTFDQISTISYNSCGWNNFKADFLSTILLSHSIHICAIQEHLLLDKNLHLLLKCFPQYNIFSLPAVKNNAQISVGRPSGGLSILYNRNMSKFIQHIVCPNSSRVY